MKKKIVLLFALLISVSVFGAKAPIQKIEKYQHEDGTIELPTNFADAILLKPDVVQKLKGKKIVHVDLVYTAFKESPNFNQTALNNRRIAQLKQALPQVNKDDPSWSWLEQEGATTKEQAATYFHGFVIHYGDPMHHSDVRSFLSSYQSKYNTYTIKNSEGGVYVHNSGSRIEIPANAVVYEDGTPVKGAYELQYREFRDQADIAFSGIPMTYDQSGETYNFSSAGMFELRAVQGDQELKLSQPARVDFNCTRQADDVDFYAMDDATGEWVKEKPIAFEANAEPQPKKLVKQPNEASVLVAKVPQPEASNWKVTWVEGAGEDCFEISEPLWEKFEKERDADPDFGGMILRTDDMARKFWAKTKDRGNIQNWIVQTQWGNGIVLGPGQRAANLGNAGTLLGEGMGDPGHTYPNLVRGLNTKRFGVYNCDQIYRIKSAKRMYPEYVDARTGESIDGKYVVSVIDLNYNGAFSFDPRNIVCNAKGRNVIVLFTKDKKTYLLPEKKFQMLDLSNNERPTFKMVDMTDELKSSEDLRKYLNL